MSPTQVSNMDNSLPISTLRFEPDCCVTITRVGRHVACKARAWYTHLETLREPQLGVVELLEEQFQHAGYLEVRQRAKVLRTHTHSGQHTSTALLPKPASARTRRCEMSPVCNAVCMASNRRDSPSKLLPPRRDREAAGEKSIKVATAISRWASPCDGTRMMSWYLHNTREHTQAR